ncbi:MAG: PhnD/SsuA/transferrin family substrate-binding protein [Planctomycetota bacterium]|nr:PhnD/SsuA/transferrin family substrate-binding protein [Planctomycetota bacterium]
MPDERPSAPIPAALSLVLLLGVLAGIVAVALAHPSDAGDVEGTGERGNVQATLAKDPLTGRRLGADGIPLEPTSGPGSPDAPIRLRFVPSGDAGQAMVAIDGMLDFLRKRTGYVVEGAILRHYGLVVQEIVYGQCDVAFLTAASYARAWYQTENNTRENDEVDAILSAVRQGHPDYPGGDLAYRGALLVLKDSPLQTIADLKDGFTAAMGNPTSGASSILPNALFNEMGIVPKVLRVEGYPIIVSSVIQGTADVGCIWWSPPNPDNPENDARIMAKGQIPDVFERTRILGYTSWIPNEPVVVRRALPAEVKRVLARAISLFVATKARTEEGRRELESVGSVVGYIPATNDDYAILFETIERAFARDPEGLIDFQGKR